MQQETCVLVLPFYDRAGHEKILRAAIRGAEEVGEAGILFLKAVIEEGGFGEAEDGFGGELVLDLGGDGAELRCSYKSWGLIGDGVVFEVGEEGHMDGDGRAETVAHGRAAEGGGAPDVETDERPPRSSFGF